MDLKLTGNIAEAAHERATFKASAAGFKAF